MPRKSKEIKPKKEETPELNRRRSARLATVEPKVKAKEVSPVKTPKRQAAKRHAKEVTEAIADDEVVNSKVDSNEPVENVEQDGDKVSVEHKDEVESKKLKIDEESKEEATKEVVNDEPSELVIDAATDKNEDKMAAEDNKEVSEEPTKVVEQNHVNNGEGEEEVKVAAT